jgi:hypothetical protein
VFGGGDAAAGLEPLPPQQVGQRSGGGLVAPLGERPSPLQLGDRVDNDPVQPPRQALAQGQRRQVFGVSGRRCGGRGQRVGGLGEEAVRAPDQACVHAPILLERIFERLPFAAGQTPFNVCNSKPVLILDGSHVPPFGRP